MPEAERGSTFGRELSVMHVVHLSEESVCADVGEFDAQVDVSTRVSGPATEQDFVCLKEANAERDCAPGFGTDGQAFLLAPRDPVSDVGSISYESEGKGHALKYRVPRFLGSGGERARFSAPLKIEGSRLSVVGSRWEL